MNVPFLRRSLLSLGYSALLAAMAGCAAAMKPVRVVGLAQKDLVLQVAIDPDANGATPVALDVVTVDNKKTLAVVAAMTSQQWFGKKTDVLRMNGKLVAVQSWEWVPGEVIPPVHVTGTTGKDAVLLFANYGTPGEHRAVLPVTGYVGVRLGEKDFALSESGKVADPNGDVKPEKKDDKKKMKLPKLEVPK